MEVMIDGVRFVPVTHDEVSLTVLVPSVSTRRKTFGPAITDALFTQHEKLSAVDQRRVEILIVTDAGRSGGMIVGDKRNAMVRMARGTYVVFVDDDDRISDDYLASLLTATESGADCITFNLLCALNGAPPKLCRYSLEYAKDHNAADHYQRLPNHITAVRRLLMLACPFPSKQFGEDAEYATRLRPSLKTQHRIDRVLYHYNFSDTTSETRKPLPPKLVAAGSPGGTVDVVILSKAANEPLHTMCQAAIDSCRAGAGRHVVNIIVIEQEDVLKYHGATTIRDAGDFNYNKFANAGAERGTAPWIMVANSDLVFEDGWLDALLSTGRECVSPVDPTHRTQRNVRHDEAGWQNGHHFSGWCFMVTRKLWERIGRFDECVSYWCSDNVVIEQCRAVDVMPLVAAASRVRHLGSQTAQKPPDDLTWAQVRVFNQKYPQRRLFIADQRYLNYCRKNGLAA